MQIRFTPPPLIASPLADLDARWRLAALVLVMIAAAVVRSLPVAGIALVMSLLLTLFARMNGRWFLERLAATAFLLALFTVPIPLLSGAEWRDGLRLAGVILCKSLTLFTLASVLLVTAPVETTLKAAHALYIPGLLVHLVLLSYRYLFVLGDELARLRVALRTRGFRNRADLHSWRTVGAASGTLLVRGHDRAERVAAAMRCRGFDGRFRTLTHFTTTWRDIIACTLALVLSAALVALDVGLMRM